MNKIVWRILLATILLVSVWVMYFITKEEQLVFAILAIIFFLYVLLRGSSGRMSNGVLFFSASSTRVGLFLPYLNRMLFLGSLLYGMVVKATEGSQSYYAIGTIMGLSLLFLILLAPNILVIEKAGLRYPFRWRVAWSDVVDFKIDISDKKLTVNLENKGSRILYFKNGKDLENAQNLIQKEKPE